MVGGCVLDAGVHGKAASSASRRRLPGAGEV